MVKVTNLYEAKNHNGKTKYHPDYHTCYTVGRMQLVYYMYDRACDGMKKNFPHLEYYIDQEFRNLGIMSRELPKYLKSLVKYGHDAIIAVVKNDNEYAPYSGKLLLQNGFVSFNTGLKDHTTFLFHSQLGNELKVLASTIGNNKTYVSPC